MHSLNDASMRQRRRCIRVVLQPPQGVTHAENGYEKGHKHFPHLQLTTTSTKINLFCEE